MRIKPSSVGLCIVAVVLGLFLAELLWGPAESGAATAASPTPAKLGTTSAAASSTRGSLPPEPARTPASPTPASMASMPTEQTLHLWPHLREPPLSAAQLAEIQAQWARLAQEHPSNIYLPSQLQLPMSPTQAQAAREQLDSRTAMEAEIATLEQSMRYASADKAPPISPDPRTVSPEELRMRRQYFESRILELESQLQLADFWLKNDASNALLRPKAEKEMDQWKSELETLRGIRASLPVR